MLIHNFTYTLTPPPVFTYNTNNNTSTCSLSIKPDSFQSGTNTFFHIISRCI